jgi:hypothetical protein
MQGTGVLHRVLFGGLYNGRSNGACHVPAAGAKEESAWGLTVPVSGPAVLYAGNGEDSGHGDQPPRK